MDQLTRYRELVKSHLKAWAEFLNRSPTEGVERQCVFDEKHDHYMVVSVGWLGPRRIRNTTVHVRLKCGKIWVEEDWTPEGFATELIRAGVPAGDIVLAFQPPALRRLTEFAPA